jgi:hypothetical protein
MSYVYNVYAHPKSGSWGFTKLTGEGDVKSVFIGQDGEVTFKPLRPLAVAPAIARLVRSGYKKLTQPQYLFEVHKDGRRFGEFRPTHPDLEMADGSRMFFAAVPPETDMNAVASEWRKRLDDADGPTTIQRDRWLEHCEGVSAYVPAPSTDAAAALLVAQWASENKQPMVSSAGEMPAAGPMELRHEWRVYLQQWFPSEVIDAAFTQLGWSMSDALAIDVRSITATTSPDGSSDSWIAAAAQAAF